MLREVMPIIAGGGVGLVLALFPCFYCVRCVAGRRATQLDVWGRGWCSPLVCVVVLSSSSFVSCVLGEVVVGVGGFRNIFILIFVTKIISVRI